MIDNAVQVNLLILHLVFDLCDWLFSHFFKQTHERAIKRAQKLIHVEVLICLDEVLLQLVNVIEGDDLHWVD